MNERIEQAAREYCIEMNYILPDDTEYSLEAQTAIRAFKYALSHQWISVEEALPEKNTMCFVRKETELGIIYDADYVDYEGKWFFNFSFNRTSIKSMVITHWMPIPSLEGGEE